MDKRLTYILLGVIGLHLVVDVFSNRNLSEALDRINALEQQLDQARVATDAARHQTDSILLVVGSHRAFLGAIEKGVEVLDMERRVREQAFRDRRDSLRLILQENMRLIDSLRRQLPGDDPVIIRSRAVTAQP